MCARRFVQDRPGGIRQLRLDRQRRCADHGSGDHRRRPGRTDRAGRRSRPGRRGIMIVTVTPNPSIDRTVTLSTTRSAVPCTGCSRVTTEPGGKGVNVARALTLAGLVTLAVLPAARHDPPRHGAAVGWCCRSTRCRSTVRSAPTSRSPNPMAPQPKSTSPARVIDEITLAR